MKCSPHRRPFSPERFRRDVVPRHVHLSPRLAHERDLDEAHQQLARLLVVDAALARPLPQRL